MHNFNLFSVLTLSLLPLIVAGAAAQDIAFVFPEPFCPDTESTEVTIFLPEAAPVRLYVTDTLLGEVGLLYEGSLTAGWHAYNWDGLDAAEDPLPTGEYEVILDTTPDSPERDDDMGCAIYCGPDLGGPFRLVYDDTDMVVAFGIGLPSPQPGSLTIRTADGATHIATLVPESAGFTENVGSGFWLLRDDDGTLVPPETYMARLVTPVYAEDLLFAVVPWDQTITVTATYRDADDQLAVGNADPASAPVVRTPLQEAWFEFSIPLTPQLFAVIGQVLEERGSLANMDEEEVELSPDGRTVRLGGVAVTPDWPNRWGQGLIALPLPWFEPDSVYFHLRHEFTFITPVDEFCNPLGPVDADDWVCGLPYWWDEDRSASVTTQVPDEVTLEPACPNPVVRSTDGVTRLRFGMPETDYAELYVVDTQGVKVRTLAAGAFLPGYYEFVWPLDDDQGIALPGGPDMYRVFLEVGPGPDETLVLCGGDVRIHEVTAVLEDPVVVAGGSRLAIVSNPVRHAATTRLLCYPGRSGPVTLAIFDVQGRRVRELLRATAAGGEAIPVVWDGRDESGAHAPGGVYFARLVAADRTVTEKVVVLR